jgi:uncharacterized cysteine cluster protein YcgN (CxxCxxCC family)
MPKVPDYKSHTERMERNENCPLLEDCSVYLNKISHTEIIGLTYRSLYCLQVNKKYKSCKRYEACTKLGKQVHRKVLPNSPYSIEEIARQPDL